MKNELESRLVEKYPGIFRDYGGDIRKTCMGWGFSHGDGWYDLIDKMCEDITNLAKDTGIEIVAEQVKEKFGGLRFYYYTSYTGERDDKIKEIEQKISDRINQAEAESYKTCEVCGKPGKPNSKGWITTLCKECEKKD
jgi:hypothetical protein